MVREPFSCLLLTIFNKRLLFRWILFRARQRVATSEQEMRAQSQYGQLPLCFGKELKKSLILNFPSLNCNKPALAVQLTLYLYNDWSEIWLLDS